MQEELAVVQKLYNTVVEFVVQYSFQILGAIIILLLGVKLANWLARLVINLGEKKKFDPTLTGFMAGAVRMVVLVFVGIIAIGKFGISIAPFIAAVSALAFGGSFAIQGPLSNYGAGLSIIVSRPFVVGDTISVKGVTGVIDEIRLACTILSTEDGEQITIPNKHIVGEIIHNSFANKVIETSVGISYNDDPALAIKTITAALANIEDISQDPPPQVGIEAFADSAISIGMRYWVPTKKYFQTFYRTNLAVHQALTKAQITIPFPQHDVHLVPMSNENSDPAA
ncbi:MAG: mechanosensitive ion channel family protein [Desulfobulbaceae bacterium]|nr:mechanosensitive ion channel family protein [Desulfobulbaceae bacterium]